MSDVSAARTWVREWLLRDALPIWWEVGADRAHGGFHDLIDQRGAAVTDRPKRARVQARQVFVYTQAGKLGWDGPWRDAVRHGLDFLIGAYKREDGLYRRTEHPDGPPEADYDLYDQAFALLAFASAHHALDGAPGPLAEAEALFAAMEAMLSHPIAGFQENVAGKLPLRSNPHMHLLEALLAWLEQRDIPAFRARAEQIVALALDHMIDPATGAVAEYFDAAWRRLGGDQDVREPGHQFEWAYLLSLAGRLLGGDHGAASERLAAFGTRHGIDRARGVAIFSIDPQGVPIDRDARLWAQTERLRTMLLVPDADALGRGTLPDEAADALSTVKRYLDVPVRGLWRDRLHPDDSFAEEPAPSSSFYHLVTGMWPLITAAPPHDGG